MESTQVTQRQAPEINVNYLSTRHLTTRIVERLITGQSHAEVAALYTYQYDNK